MEKQIVNYEFFSDFPSLFFHMIPMIIIIVPSNDCEDTIVITGRSEPKIQRKCLLNLGL